jgi:hypothetical protein
MIWESPAKNENPGISFADLRSHTTAKKQIIYYEG